MCEANVYLINDEGEERLFMDSVDKIVPDSNKLHLENIFGQSKTVRARIKEMTLVDHRIIIEKLVDG